MKRACGYFGNLRFLSQFSQFDGEKVFSFYRGEGRSATGENLETCPLPTLAWVDQPAAGTKVKDELKISGWAINEGLGVSSITVLLNDETIGTANYGIAREDVIAAMTVQTDPNAPNVGFDFSIATSKLPKGRGVMSLKATGVSGETQIFGVRTVDID